MSKNKKKDLGQIFTPFDVVDEMLTAVGYCHSTNKDGVSPILKKHVIDNSCGCGRILTLVVTEYITDAQIHGYNNEEIKHDLEKYIHGIEIDPDECRNCKSMLDIVAQGNGLSGVNWDIRCENTLRVKDYDGKMDFVIGNPPYIRIHNAEDIALVKSFDFAKNGMTDTYLAFYEIGLKMMNETGKMVYISPSSWYTSDSAAVMREYIMEHRQLKTIMDFGHTQVFPDAQTYVAISIFTQDRHEKIEFGEITSFGAKYSCAWIEKISYEKMYIRGKFYFASESTLEKLRVILEETNEIIEVKNGYATLCDDVFIENLPKLSKYTIPIVKASTGKSKTCLFPYEDLKPVSLDKIKDTAPDVYDYIMLNENRLKDRAYDGKGSDNNIWWVLGRSQGISDTNRKRFAVNAYIQHLGDIYITELDPGVGIYGGLYITSDLLLNKDTLYKIIRSDEFVDYVRALRKYRSGGYYSYTSKDLSKYLNSKLCPATNLLNDL